MSSLLLHPEVHASKDFLPITGTDYIEFYVGNARQSAYFYRAAFGMSLVAWAGPETGLHDRSSYVLQQGDIRFILTTPLRPDGGIADHIRRHGDGVRDIALAVDDAKLTWRETTRRGARSVHECHELRDEYGKVKLASIAAYGDTIHTFVERGGYYGPFLPGYEPVGVDSVSRPTGLTQIDHIAANVGWNEMGRCMDYYNDILGFSLKRNLKRNLDEYCPTGGPSIRGAQMHGAKIDSGVVFGGRGSVRFSIDGPALDREKSGVERYLEFYHGPGVEHIALATNDILDTVAKMRRQGVEFLDVPRSYYQRLSAGAEGTDKPAGELAKLGILIESDQDGHLLRAFTRPVEDRPTLFFEILQRKGSRSFPTENESLLAQAAGKRP
jgi:4-hydroxyphenylpyruvate dioxygenase